jgi:uncharacterized Zn finger protein
MTIPWSERLVTRLRSLGISAMDAGKGSGTMSGEVSGEVSGLTVAAGSITAQVQGSRRRPYDVWIELPVFSPAQWARAERAIADDGSCYEQILDGDLPADLEEVFARCGLALFPAKAQDLAMDCSCPDWVVPCPHVRAVLFALAEAFDAEPFAILTWRGRTRSRLLDHLHDLRKITAPSPRPVDGTGVERPLAECLDDFWLEGGQPYGSGAGGLQAGGHDQPGAAGRQPADLALSRLTRSDLVIRGRNLTDLLSPAYDAFSRW